MATKGMGSHDRSVGMRSGDLTLTNAAKEALFARKVAASQLAQTLADDAKTLSHDLPPDLVTMFESFAWLPAFAKQFELASMAAFYAVRGLQADQQSLADVAAKLHSLAGSLEKLFEASPDVPHHTRVLLAPSQIHAFLKSLPLDE